MSEEILNKNNKYELSEQGKEEQEDNRLFSLLCGIYPGKLCLIDIVKRVFFISLCLYALQIYMIKYNNPVEYYQEVLPNLTRIFTTTASVTAVISVLAGIRK